MIVIMMPLGLLAQSTGSTGDAPLSGPLYAVIGVIAVFVLIIITLSIVIVLLCRRKCGHGETRTAGQCIANLVL